MNMDIPLEDQVVEILKTIYDPEIPVNIVDLGLIYSISIENKMLTIQMTLTNPACPVAGEFPRIVENQLYDMKQFDNVHVELVFEPAWTTERMSEAAKLQLGIL